MEESRIAATDRLRKERRWDEACRYRDEVRKRLRSEGVHRVEAADAAWEAMPCEFPPKPVRDVDEVLARAQLVTQQLADKRRATDDEWLDIVAWTLDHLHMVPDPEKPDSWELKPQDSPTARHWNLLCYARSNQEDFTSKAFQCLTQAQLDRERRGGCDMEMGAPTPLNDVDYAEIKKVMHL